MRSVILWQSLRSNHKFKLHTSNITHPTSKIKRKKTEISFEDSLSYDADGNEIAQKEYAGAAAADTTAETTEAAPAADATTTSTGTGNAAAASVAAVMAVAGAAAVAARKRK